MSHPCVQQPWTALPSVVTWNANTPAVAHVPSHPATTHNTCLGSVEGGGAGGVRELWSALPSVVTWLSVSRRGSGVGAGAADIRLESKRTGALPLELIG